MAAPSGNIDKLVVIDQGGNGDSSSNGMARLANTGPAVVFNLLQQLSALGIDLPSVMNQLGIEKKLGKTEAGSTKANA